MSDDKMLDWFVHDSNNCLTNIASLIEIYLESDAPDKKLLARAQLMCRDALHMNGMLRNGDPNKLRMAGENLKLWARNRSYPNVEVTADRDFGFPRVRYMMSVVIELTMNAYKAGAKTVRIALKDDDGYYLLVSNDGKPIEDSDRMFEKGFSTFGTSGSGMSIIQDICRHAEFALTLVDPVNVTFRLQLYDKEFVENRRRSATSSRQYGDEMSREWAMNIDEFSIGMAVMHTMNQKCAATGKMLGVLVRECVITDKTSNSIEVLMPKASEHGIDCRQWFDMSKFNKQFKKK